MTSTIELSTGFLSILPMRNLYLENAGPMPAAPKLERQVGADVAIVGGGYTGLSTALHLAKQGLQPIVLESEGIGHGCSGRNGGQVNPGLKLVPDEIEANWGANLGARMVALSSAAPAEVFSLIEHQGIECDATRHGTICAAIDGNGLRQVRTMVEQYSRRGHPVTFFNADDIAAATGTATYIGGAHDARGGHINPLKYAHGLALAAQRAGAVIHAHSRVLSLKREAGAWRVSTAGGSVVARRLVIATNGYTGDLWPGLKRIVVPLYTYITASEPLPERLRRSIMPSGAALYEAAWDVIYYRVDEAGRLLIGGRGPQRASRGPEDYRHLVEYACKLWPQLKGVSWPWHWFGQVAITKDHLPHLIEPEPDVHLMLGYNGRGIALATVAGRLIAERIVSDGKATIDLPVRQNLMPVPFQPLWKMGANLSIGWNLARDHFTRR